MGWHLVHTAGVASYLPRLPMASNVRIILHILGKRRIILASRFDAYKPCAIAIDRSIDPEIRNRA